MSLMDSFYLGTMRSVTQAASYMSISVYFRFLAMKLVILVISVTFMLCRSVSLQNLKKLLLSPTAFHK